MMSSTPTSVAIGELLAIMEPYRGSGEVIITGESWDAILDDLQGIRHTAVLDERELGSFRLIEAARFQKGTMEEVATGAAGELLLDPEGKVVRPNFGGRS